MTEKPSTFDIKFDSAGDFDKARELIERMNAALFEKDQRIEELEQSEEKLINERDEMEERVNTICEQLDLSESDATWSNLNDPAERACEYIAALVAQIDRVRALAENWQKRVGYSYFSGDRVTFKVCTMELLAALGAPASTPERKP